MEIRLPNLKKKLFPDIFLFSLSTVNNDKDILKLRVWKKSFSFKNFLYQTAMQLMQLQKKRNNFNKKVSRYSFFF